MSTTMRVVRTVLWGTLAVVFLALAAMGKTRPLRRNVRQYVCMYDMVDCVGSVRWNDIGVPGPAPRRPAG